MNNIYYKTYVEKLINFNPTLISIERSVKTPDGYGGHTITKTLVEETVTFYERKSRREILTDYGKTFTGVSVTKILAKGDADIIKGDLFTVDGIRYRVLFPKDYFGICKQIELEVIEDES